MESNFKGTKGRVVVNVTRAAISLNEGFYTIEDLDTSDNIMLVRCSGDASDVDKEHADIQLVLDAFEARNKINCSLPEFMERFKAMEGMLKMLHRKLEHPTASVNALDVIDIEKLLTQKTVIE